MNNDTQTPAEAGVLPDQGDGHGPTTLGGLQNDTDR